MTKKREDLTGQVFGRLTVIEFSHKNKHGNLCWLCKCECGNTKIITASALKGGLTKSCGCLRKEIVRKPYKTKGKTKNNRRKAGKVKEYKLPPVELENYLKGLQTKEVQYVGIR